MDGIELSNVIPSNNMGKDKKNVLTRDKKRLLFYIALMIFPLMHYLIFFIIVNASMFTMAFEIYSIPEGQIGYVSSFAGFENFKTVFKMFENPQNLDMLWNSLIVYGWGLLFMPLSIFFSFYIYKNFFMAKFFRVILFLPQILSVVVTTILYKYMFIWALKIPIDFTAILIYNIWSGFGVNIIMYTGAMCGINESIFESAQLDGANTMQELWFVTFPMVFPTFVTFQVTSITAIFTSQAHLFTFFDAVAPFRTVGYFMYVQSLNSNVVINSDLTSVHAQLTYPQLCAFSLIITAIILPTTLLLRRLLNKVGPSVD